MAKTYVSIDGGANVDPFWGTTVQPSMRGKTMQERTDDLKKSFYKNAEKIDFVPVTGGGITLGKIGMSESDMEFRIWKSFEHIHNTENVEELFKCTDEQEAVSEFKKITGGSFNLEVNTGGRGIKGNSYIQPEIGKSKIETCDYQKDLIQDQFDYMAKSNFAKNAQKIDFVSTNGGQAFVLGVIGKSEIDKNAKYRIWKTHNPWTNDEVEYLTDDINRRDANIEFKKILDSIK